MSDRHQDLAVVTENLRKHFSAALAAVRDLDSLNEELRFDPFDEVSNVLTDLLLTSSSVSSLETNVVAYFSLRAGGRGASYE